MDKGGEEGRRERGGNEARLSETTRPASPSPACFCPAPTPTQLFPTPDDYIDDGPQVAHVGDLGRNDLVDDVRAPLVALANLALQASPVTLLRKCAARRRCASVSLASPLTTRLRGGTMADLSGKHAADIRLAAHHARHIARVVSTGPGYRAGVHDA